MTTQLMASRMDVFTEVIVYNRYEQYDKYILNYIRSPDWSITVSAFPHDTAVTVL